MTQGTRLPFSNAHSVSNDDFTKSEYFNPWQKPKRFTQTGHGPAHSHTQTTTLSQQFDLPFLQELTVVRETTKPNVICDALYSYLSKNGVTQENYLSLLTALVKYSPPKVEEALTLVQELKGRLPFLHVIDICSQRTSASRVSSEVSHLSR